MVKTEQLVDNTLELESIKEELRLCLTTPTEREGKMYEVQDFNPESISIRELWLYCVGVGKPIHWIKSYKTLIRYVSDRYVDVLNPTVEGEASGKRYFMTLDDIATYIYTRRQKRQQA